MHLLYYYHPTSQPSRAVQAFMHLIDVQYDKRIVDLFTCEHRTAEFAKINPLNQVPCIDDHGFKLGDAEAIMKYLINTRKTGELYYPTDPQVRAIIDWYLPWHHSTFRPALATYFMTTYKYLRNYTHMTKTLDEVRPEAENVCKKFQEVFLKDQRYLGGDVITIADLLAVNELTQLYYATDFDFNKFPKIKDYIMRCLENPVIHEVQKDIKAFPETVKQLPRANL